MRTVKYKPREWAMEPAAFGRVESIRWKPIKLTPGQSAVGVETDDERRKRERSNLKRPRDAAARLAASQMQHAYAVRIRARIEATNSNLTKYARKTGAEYDHLNKVMRGDMVMTLEDIARAHQEFGGIHPLGVPAVSPFRQ